MFRRILTILTLILVVLVIWGARNDIVEAVSYLTNANLFFIFLLIPEQLLMYYCSGQIFFSYLKAKLGSNFAAPSATPPADDSSVQAAPAPSKPLSPWTLARISFELNFVNQAIPSGGFAGLGYVTWRLKAFGSSVGQTSFMYVLRYIITILANQLQTLLAILALLIIGGVSSSAWWVIGLTSLVCVAIVGGLAAIVLIASSQKRINWFANLSTKVINGFVRTATFGHKRQLVRFEDIARHLDDVYHDLTVARQNRRILLKPALWGIVYSFLEIAAYWLVGISFGHPEILPQIMIGEAVAAVVGTLLLTPGGVGGYEGAMVFVMSALGVEVGLATAVVITTRVLVLLSTVVSGYGFYQNAVSKLGKSDRRKIFEEGDNNV